MTDTPDQPDAPATQPESQPASAPESTPGPTPASKSDRAVAEGLPPDSGPEQRVMLVSEAMLRSRPLAYFGHLIVALAGVAGLIYFALVKEPAWTFAAWASVGGTVLAIASMSVWKIKTLTRRLEITNKRTVRRIGLFSRDTSEVLHDHVRNIEIKQSLWERIWGVGEIGISSSGQDGIEITMQRVPRPHEVRRIIDLYRPLG